MDEDTPQAIQMLQAVTKVLGNWDNCHYRLWEYYASHATLTIELSKNDTTEILHLVCVGCDYVKSPRSVKLSNLKIIRKSVDNNRCYVLFDEKNGIEVCAGTVVATPKT